MDQTNHPTGIEALVCADVASRQALGIGKYGVTVADNPLSLREWLEHAYQECLDQAVYLRRAMAEIDSCGIICTHVGEVSVLGISERLRNGQNKFPENMGETICPVFESLEKNREPSAVEGGDL